MTTRQKLLQDIKKEIYAAETKSRQNKFNTIGWKPPAALYLSVASLREWDFRLSKFDAAVVARRMAHKYVDGYYSWLAAHRKRSENFRATYT